MDKYTFNCEMCGVIVRDVTPGYDYPLTNYCLNCYDERVLGIDDNVDYEN